ncbi:MAG: serine/threonine protein kinase [Deltaproteobacteria bacterium]|nr:serine/threonine protein kinase [Deltaproteobacteria bacterium]
MAYYQTKRADFKISLASIGQKLREALDLRILAGFSAAALLLVGVGWYSYGSIKNSVRSQVQVWLETMLEADVQELSVWFEVQRSALARLAADAEVERSAVELMALEEDASAGRRALLQSAALSSLKETFKEFGEQRELFDFFVAAASGRYIAAAQEEHIGNLVPESLYGFMREVLGGKAAVAPNVGSPDRLLIGVPLRNESGKPAAVLGFSIRPELSFAKVLIAGRRDSQAESLVFNTEGLIISGSERGQIVAHGRFAPKKGRPNAGFGEYLGNSGEMMVGAWGWLSDYGVGLLTRMRADYAYRALEVLQRTFGVLFGLLVASTFGCVLVSYALIIWRRRAQKELQEARHLGPYVLEERIGKGGMGEVYRAKHRLLRRPTAIKLIRSEAVSVEALNQFEREVQLTSQLRHPNTIAIYDYGRTPDNIFYYAMEYLDGMTLKELVGTYGPQPEARVIHVLQGICASLHEAHQAGLVHRDIKPANVMLCSLGGLCDVVKVLDFGLVTDLTRPGEGALGPLLGSIRFIAPEVMLTPQAIDARSDIYSVGALAYYILTGGYVFCAQTDLEYQRCVLSQDPDSSSSRLGKAIETDLAQVVMACLSRDLSARPQDVLDLSARLANCRAAGEWNHSQAKEWWTEYGKHCNDHDGSDAMNATRAVKSVQTLTVVAAERQ